MARRWFGKARWFGAPACAATLLLPVLSASTAPGPADPVLDARTALIVVDLQNSIEGRPTLEPVNAIVARARSLAEAFRCSGSPVVLVRSATQPPGRTQQAHRATGPVDLKRSELLPALGVQPSDHVIAKIGWSAFSRTDLAKYLRRRRVTQLVILGYSTSIAVESTARDAYDLGYNVTIVSDATTDTAAEVHDAAMTRIFPRLGEVVKTEQVRQQIQARCR